MTFDDFDSIEGQLGLDLPPEYRRLLEHYPAELFRSVGQFELSDNPRFVIEETTRCRLEGFSGESRPESKLLVIGDDGCGNYCCLDLNQEPATVVAYDHETDSFSVIAWSLEGWLKSLAHRSQSR
jgi:hypothetical protein